MIEPDRWQRLWTIFHGALERAPGEERARFLEDACGEDRTLHSEIDSLLEHSAAERGPLAEGVPLAAELLPTEEWVGRRIGRYRIERLLGEGGMGLVFEATQEEPVRRRVALKLVKLGMDTREFVRRFAAERQALALMDHSSIAKVFDAGATSDGRPYFAMELVDGPPVTEYCDRERLPLARRIELFVAVCRAVNHAHQKGVIHRDLKASNVLVATEESKPVPKVIDFGVARAIGERGAGETLLTRLGQIVGTPEAMSPEQAASSPDLDTRTDVYSLGALLYELLCGEPPFDRGSSSLASLTELLRRIREDDPPPPGARFVRCAEEQASAISVARSTEPTRLARDLRGELDWIAMRALAKERERRYGSAAELGDDLERHLAGRPVAAGPPSRVYRFRKLLARNRFAAGAAAAFLTALVAFGGAMAVQARRLARALEVQQRERTTATRVSDFLAELLEQPDPAVARGTEPTVRQVLDRGAARIESELAGEPEIQARLLETIGRVDLNLGHYEGAGAAFERALELRKSLRGELHEEVAADLQRLGEVEYERARFDEARRLVEAALEIRKTLHGERDPSLADPLHVLGLLRRAAGDLAGAEALHRRALDLQLGALAPDDPAIAESYNYLGIVRRRSGDLAGAEAAYRKAFELWRAELGDDHPKVAMAMNNLALTVHVRGDYDEAKRLFEELLPLRRRVLGGEHPDYQLTLSNYAKLLHDRRELAAAARVYEESLAIARRVLGEEHPQFASPLADFGAVLAKLGRTDEALAAEEQALAVRRKVFGPEHSAVAASLGYLAQVRAARGEVREAEQLFEESIAMFRRKDGETLRTAEAILAHGEFLLVSGELARAERVLGESLALLRTTLAPRDRQIGRAESALGACLGRLGRFDEGEALLEASLDKLASPGNPDTADARERLAELRAARIAAARTRSTR